MIPFDWFRSRKQRLLIQETELDRDIEVLKLEKTVLNKRDERDKLLTEVKARRLVRAGNGSGVSTETEAIDSTRKASPRRPVHKTVSTRKETC